MGINCFCQILQTSYRCYGVSCETFTVSKNQVFLFEACKRDYLAGKSTLLIENHEVWRVLLQQKAMSLLHHAFSQYDDETFMSFFAFLRSFERLVNCYCKACGKSARNDWSEGLAP